MSQLDDIMQHVPVDQLAQRFGVDQSQVRGAAEHALPALLGGLKANADDPAGAGSIMSALSQHTGGMPDSLDQVNTEEGQKIVGHIFGGNTDEVVNRLGGVGGGGATGGLAKKLLPVLAPIVMRWLASRVGGAGGLGGVLGGQQQGGNTGSSAAAGQSASGGLQDVLGSVLGGHSGSGSGSGGGVLGGLLGGLLGQGRR